MANRQLKTLAKSLDFSTERQAAEYIWSSYVNGNVSGSKRMFRDLGQSEQSRCLKYLQEMENADNLLEMVVYWLD